MGFSHLIKKENKVLQIQHYFKPAEKKKKKERQKFFKSHKFGEKKKGDNFTIFVLFLLLHSQKKNKEISEFQLNFDFAGLVLHRSGYARPESKFLFHINQKHEKQLHQPKMKDNYFIF